MRVCWAIYGDLEQPTGGYVYDRLVVEGLRARGDDVDVVDLLETPVLPASSSGRGVFDAIVGDALCVQELGGNFEAAPRDTARLLLVHHLTSWELERPDGDALRAVEARAIAAADRLVVTGRATGARLFDVHAGRAIDVIAPGADRLPRRPRADRDDDRVALLFVGSLIPRKRLPMLLDAVECLGAAGLTLTIAGDAGRDPAHARDVSARVHGSAVLRAAVQIAGVLGDDDLARAMADADALVLPSSLEGYGMVLTEAIHAGLAVIASRPAALAADLGEVDGLERAGVAGDLRELTRPRAAMVFDDADGLVRALRAFAGDPALRAAMQGAARATRLPRWSETVDSFRGAITRAVAAARGRDRAPSPQ
jgi:glycosyltransferase involved in cell wall biosynthesis